MNPSIQVTLTKKMTYLGTYHPPPRNQHANSTFAVAVSTVGEVLHANLTILSCASSIPKMVIWGEDAKKVQSANMSIQSFVAAIELVSASVRTAVSTMFIMPRLKPNQAPLTPNLSIPVMQGQSLREVGTGSLKHHPLHLELSSGPRMLVRLLIPQTMGLKGSLV